jgi:cobyric acid synthase
VVVIDGAGSPAEINPRDVTAIARLVGRAL